MKPRTKTTEFKLVLTAWQLIALESILDGKVKIENIESNSFEALKTKVIDAWSQAVTTPPRFGEGKSGTGMIPRALE